MKEPKNVVLTIDGKALTMELDLKDEDLIELFRTLHRPNQTADTGHLRP